MRDRLLDILGIGVPACAVTRPRRPRGTDAPLELALQGAKL
ncbi:MAG: hypothetical protein AB7J63_14300 [Vicinamibacterales bacterium]